MNRDKYLILESNNVLCLARFRGPFSFYGEIHKKEAHPHGDSVKDKKSPYPGGKSRKSLVSGEYFTQKGDNSAQAGEGKDNPQNPPYCFHHLRPPIFVIKTGLL